MSFPHISEEAYFLSTSQGVGCSEKLAAVTGFNVFICKLMLPNQILAYMSLKCHFKDLHVSKSRHILFYRKTDYIHTPT